MGQMRRTNRELCRPKSDMLYRLLPQVRTAPPDLIQSITFSCGTPAAEATMSETSLPKTAQIPVTALTGNLGAGKTTPLNRILSESHGKNIRFLSTSLVNWA